MTVSAQSRIAILDTPILAPGVCSLCGSSGDDKRKFIDFGKQLDWYGAVYFCTICFAEMAQATGHVPVAEFNSLLNAHKTITSQLQVANDSNKAYKDALSSIFAQLGRDPDSVDDYVRRLSSIISEPEISGEDNSESPEGESETNESSNVEGSDDLFDDSDFER